VPRASGRLGRFGPATTLAYLGALAGSVVAAELLGDLPTGLGRRGSPVALAPTLVLAVGLLGVRVADRRPVVDAVSVAACPRRGPRPGPAASSRRSSHPVPVDTSRRSVPRDGPRDA